MAADNASSVQGVRLRVTPLNIDGTVKAGSHIPCIDGFIKADFTTDWLAGGEISEVDAQGRIAIEWKAKDSLKDITFNLQLVSPDPELAQLLSAGDLLWEGSEIVGYSGPPVGDAPDQPNAIEIWSIANIGGKPASGTPYFRWLFPYVTLRFDGTREFSNTALVNSFTGIGVGNSALVITDWTWGGEDVPFNYVRVADLPTVGYTGTPPTP